MSTPRRLSYDYSEGFAKPVYATEVVEQPWESYTEEDHQTWRTLFERQEKVLLARAAPLYLESRKLLGLESNQIPKFEALNQKLQKATGWTIVGVDGLLPGDVFFKLLTEKRFPVTWWIRSPEQLDYLPEPDLFHDLYGHVPMLMNPDFANFVQVYGQTSERIKGDLNLEAQLSRLYWYTVEFGLMGTPANPLISGAGILSSKTESEYATDSPIPVRLPFDLEEVLERPYRIDTFQDCYFLIEDFGAWYRQVKPVLENMGREKV